MVTAFYSSVLDHPADEVWSLIRDFNNYPAYIDGVTESVIEDGKPGDEAGAVRRFCYMGNWIRQRLVRHSDEERLITYACVDPFSFPREAAAPAGKAAPQAPVRYEGTIHLRPVTDGDRCLIEWPVELDTAAGDEAAWRAIFEAWLPQWADSLRRTLDQRTAG